MLHSNCSDIDDHFSDFVISLPSWLKDQPMITVVVPQFISFPFYFLLSKFMLSVKKWRSSFIICFGLVNWLGNWDYVLVYNSKGAVIVEFGEVDSGSLLFEVDALCWYLHQGIVQYIDKVYCAYNCDGWFSLLPLLLVSISSNEVMTILDTLSMCCCRVCVAVYEWLWEEFVLEICRIMLVDMQCSSFQHFRL